MPSWLSKTVILLLASTLAACAADDFTGTTGGGTRQNRAGVERVRRSLGAAATVERIDASIARLEARLKARPWENERRVVAVAGKTIAMEPISERIAALRRMRDRIEAASRGGLRSSEQLQIAMDEGFEVGKCCPTVVGPDGFEDGFFDVYASWTPCHGPWGQWQVESGEVSWEADLDPSWGPSDSDENVVGIESSGALTDCLDGMGYGYWVDNIFYYAEDPPYPSCIETYVGFTITMDWVIWSGGHKVESDTGTSADQCMGWG